MPTLILGPMLRYVSSTEATVWVETDGRCEVEILGRSIPTFHVAGRHYGLVVLRDLEPGSSTEYDVRLDGEVCWPPSASPYPASRIQTLPASGRIEIVWGSCRVTAPHEPPYTLDVDDDARGVGVDALYVLALRLRDQAPEAWPRMLLLIGDQVYADEVSPMTLNYIRGRRDVNQPPGEEVNDVGEYTMLYREAFSQPALRWLFSTIPSAMMFDDHDVHDDWNTSEAWIEDARATDWWPDRILAGLSTYWLYQHIGNVSPDELDRNDLLARIREAEDGAPLLREFALAAEREGGGSLWSFSRMIGNTRLVVLDGREGRVLSDGQRAMMDEPEWTWFTEQVTGDYDHVLIANTLPVLLSPTLHYIEAWNEAVCGGAWGKLAVGPSEKLRRALDLEHWAAFQDSFHRMVATVREVGSGRHGLAPASIVMLGGDVHQAYLEHVGFRPGSGVTSAVYQAVCSPFRNQLAARQRKLLGAVRRSKAVGRAARWLARSAGVKDPEVQWRVVQRPTWRNQLGWLHLDGRRLALRIESTPGGHEAALEVTLEHQLA